MRKALLVTICLVLLTACNKPAEKPAEAATEDKPVPQSELADGRYSDMGKKALEQLASGDVDGWVSNYAENVIYYWSSGDSLAGKTAVRDYWKERRTKVIDSISFVNDIWIPLKVNKPQKGPDAPGIWLLSWYQVKVKYKNGKKLQMWVHTDMHYDSLDKIDIVVQYIDRAPINAALAAK
ncbi:MAG: hypothetical protein ACOYXT_20700 [Bacteroidota bacterium]